MNLQLDAPTIEVRPRNFLPQNFRFQNWEDVEPYYNKLLQQNINSKNELEKWLENRSELESFMSEESAWRYINFTRDTENEEAREKYSYFIQHVKPHVAPLSNQLDKKLLASAYINDLEGDAFMIYIRSTKNDIELYREENIPLFVKAEELAQQYADIQSKMTIEHEGREYTLQQAAAFLRDLDRNVRKDIFEKVANRRFIDNEELDRIFDELVKIRHKIAINAGYPNFRDYQFQALGRFDYNLQDVYNFHESIKAEVVPLREIVDAKRKKDLGYDELRPYDMEVNVHGKAALKPYENSTELIEKSIEVFKKLHTVLGDYLKVMHERGFLDLESRKGKAPGGYNYPLDETGIPFIFMNSSGRMRDMVTMMHEGGHAVHSFLTRNLPINAFKHTPSEVAELASMSMELLSMNYWKVFFPEEDDLKRARLEHLEGIIDSLPWIATVDKFQNWIYTNPEHSREERSDAWESIVREFESGIVDYSDYESFIRSSWQRQLHIYEVPFYYIEYGIAQLGALAVWKNYRENAEKGLQQYINALKLGYTHTVPDIYQTANIKFDFSRNYVHQLAVFIKQELEELQK